MQERAESDAEASWVARARAGDPEAFAAIIGAYRDRLYAHCLARVGNPADAEDLTQETFLRAYRALDRTTDLALNAWLYRIATNACTDLFRRRRVARWEPWDECAPGPLARGRADDPEAALLDAEAWRAFERACAALRPRHRLILLLRARDGLALAEIGATLGLTGPAVKSLLHRARAEYRAVAGASPR